MPRRKHQKFSSPFLLLSSSPLSLVSVYLSVCLPTIPTLSYWFIFLANVNNIPDQCKVISMGNYNT